MDSNNHINLPSWARGLDEDIQRRLVSKLNKTAFSKLCELGVNHWNSIAQSVTNSLHRAGFDSEELNDILTASGDAYEEPVTPRDIKKVISNASKPSPQKGKVSTAWPAFNRSIVDGLISESTVNSVAELVASMGTPETTEPNEILSKLYSDDSLLCLAMKAQEKFVTKKLSEWMTKGIHHNFIVPSAMSSRTGLTKEGGKSGRCADNTGERQYLVIEFDKLSYGEQVAMIMKLSTMAPLVMVLDTGNKSLHTWFRCDDETEEERRRFMSYAVSLGADKATWTACQLVRLPGGKHHKTGKPHQVLVFRYSEAKNDEWDIDSIPVSTKDETCPTPSPVQRVYFPPNGVFYSAGEGGYYVDVGTHYRPYGRKSPVKSGLDRHFLKQGFSADDRKAMVASCLESIELDQAVDWAGSLAGYERGLINYKGRNFLVTEGFQIPDAEAGECPLHHSIIEQAFPDELARMMFLCWVAIAVRAIRAHIHQPSPMLVLAGAPNAGKTLLASIVKNALGGRSANPMSAWTGQLPWNDNLLGCELLLIDDAVSSTDPRARKAFGARFKEAIYAGDVAINTRRKSSVTMRPVWRVMVCCNETAENLSVIPPLEEGIEDKISLLRVSKIKTPMPASSSDEREKFSAALKKELPYFLCYLESIKVPEELKDSRTGVLAWKDPELLASVNNISPEQKLENLIQLCMQNQTLSCENGERWITASELESILTDNGSRSKSQAQALLKYHTNCGSYLSALVKRGSKYVTESKKIKGTTHYLLKSPYPSEDIFE